MNNENDNKDMVGTIARTILVIIALANQVLLIFGKSIIPISDDQVQTLVSTGFTIITSLLAWWKNNSFTAAAREADKTLAKLKEEEKV